MICIKSDTLLLADIFESFSKKVFRNLSTRLCKAPGLVWQTDLKKTEVKSELPTDIDMLLTVEKGNKAGICHSINR